MEDIRQDSIVAFDSCFTNNQIRMLKILLPFCHNSLQKHIAVFIRFQELQYTMDYFSHTPAKIHVSEAFDFANIYQQLFPYCTNREKQNLTQICNLLNTIENMKNIMNMMDIIKDIFPESGENANEEGMNFDIMTTLAGILGGDNTSFHPDTLISLAGMFSSEAPTSH